MPCGRNLSRGFSTVVLVFLKAIRVRSLTYLFKILRSLLLHATEACIIARRALLRTAYKHTSARDQRKGEYDDLPDLPNKQLHL